MTRRSAGIAAVLFGLALDGAAAAGELRGRVTVEGRALGAATVSAIPWESSLEAARREARGGPAPAALATAATRPDGSFILSLGPDLPRVALRFEGPGVAPARLAGVFDGGPSEEVGEVRLAEAASLSGRVVDGRGKGVAGATVTLEPGRAAFSGEDDVQAEPLVARTGPDGAFLFDRASRTGNRLRVEADGFATTAVAGLRSGTLAAPIALAPAGALSGRVLGIDGRSPAPRVLVRAEDAAATRWVETDTDGRFRIRDAPAAPARVVAEGGPLGRAELAPRAAPEPLTLVLVRPAAIAGRIVDATTGAPVARVRVWASKGATGVAAERSGPDGRYRLEGLAPGRYRLTADEPRRVPYARDDVLVEAGRTVTVDLPLTPAASLSGKVVDERGRPVAGAAGRLRRPGAGRAGRRPMPLFEEAGEPAFRTGPDGTFRAERLAPGPNQQLSVSHPEFERRTLAGLDLAAGGTRSGLTVVLRRGLEVEGLVLDPEGRPLSGAEIEARPSASERSGRGGGFLIEALGRRGGEEPPAVSGGDGRFRLSGLSPGAYALRARKEGFAETSRDPVRVERDEPAPTVELRLPPGATIRGFVRRPDGRGAKGHVVRARPEGEAEGGPLGLGPVEPTGEDGAFAIDGLRAGETYTLLLLGPAGPGPRQAGVRAPAEDVEIPVPGAGRITGRVVDAASGEPVREFTVSYEPELARGGPVRFLRPPRRLARRLAGDEDEGVVRSEDGRFSLEDVPAGTWTVAVEARGYEPARVSGVTVREEEETADVLVQAAKGRALRGRATDALSGRPVVGATVAAEEAEGGRPPLPPGLEEGAAYTDAEGRFELLGLALGTVKLVARHPEYAEASKLVELRGAAAEVEIRLGSGSALGGVVVSEGGAPVGGASVAVQAGGGGFRFGPPGLEGATALSDDAGRFRVDRLAAGRYTVTATLRGRSSTPLDVPLQAGESREDLRLALDAGATVRGRVVGLEASLLSSTMVTASGPQGYFAGVRPAGDGSFVLGGVPAGTIDLRAMAGDFQSGTRTASAQVRIAEGQAEAEADIVFEAGGAISGRITRGGEPVAEVTLTASGEVAPGAFARSDATGSYRIEGLRDGAYTVTALPPRGAPRRQTVEVAGEATLDFDLPLARLAGRVVEAGSGLPLGEAEVEADTGSGRGRPRATTDSGGRFALEGLEPGPVTLTARRTGYVYERRTVEAREDAAAETTFELKRGEGLGLRARDGVYGVPLPLLFVRVKDGSGAEVFGGPISLDSEGRGEVPSLRAGSYSLRMGAAGYAPLTARATVPSPTLDLAFTAGGSLEVRCGPQTQARSPRARLLDPTGAPVSEPPFGPEGWVTLTGEVRRFDHLAAAGYTLEVEGGPSRPVRVTEGGAAVVELP